MKKWLVFASLFVLSSALGRADARKLETLIRAPSTRFVLAETQEGSHIAELVLGKGIRTELDVDSLLTRLERNEFQDLAAGLERKLSLLGSSAPTVSALVPEAQAAWLRDFAERELRLTRNPRGTAEFLDLHTAKGSLHDRVSDLRGLGIDPELECFDGRLLPVRRVPSERKTQEGAVNVRSLLGEREQVVLGVTEKGDFSLIVGDLRYAGTILHTPTVTPYPAGVPAGGGILVRFVDLPNASIRALREVMSAESQSATLSCVNAACVKLAKAGVRLRGSQEQSPIFRSPFLYQMIRDGFETTEGTNVQYEIYMTSDRTFADFFGRMTKMDIFAQRALRQAKARGELDLESLVREHGSLLDLMDEETRTTLFAVLESGVVTGFVFAPHKKAAAL